MAHCPGAIAGLPGNGRQIVEENGDAHLITRSLRQTKPFLVVRLRCRIITVASDGNPTQAPQESRTVAQVIVRKHGPGLAIILARLVVMSAGHFCSPQLL